MALGASRVFAGCFFLVSHIKAPQGSIPGSGCWYVWTLGVFWGWSKLLFQYVGAENLQEKLECTEHADCVAEPFAAKRGGRYG